MATPNERPTSLANVVYNRLKQMIYTKEILPGARLVERNLADMLDVSRVPIREALLMLRKDGLVFDKPDVGLCVVEVTAEENREFLEVLTALDTLVIRLVFDNITEDVLQKILANVEATGNAIDAGDIDEAYDRSVEFHRLLREAAGNKYLIEVCDQTEFLMTWHLPKDVVVKANYDTHVEIAHALKIADKKALYTAFLKHSRLLGEHFDAVVGKNATGTPKRFAS